MTWMQQHVSPGRLTVVHGEARHGHATLTSDLNRVGESPSCVSTRLLLGMVPYNVRKGPPDLPDRARPGQRVAGPSSL